ncbi:endoglucanase [Colletotrichum cuscutae]|uniref:Endoglucanase n=1 Tax=Colletotrichum cuscutae TaxID=1209917 RepID=A0AAI9VDB1_9PEZI|nr:endoglucanase [Colletotrichum cuscutae]
MYANAIVAFGLATLASAHMKMSKPVPYDNANLDNSPLIEDGSNFPCKSSSYNAAGASNVYAQGATGELAFIGSAVHGGGSCQVSITWDAKPDKNSVWKVIKSIEGGCPAKNTAGNLGDNANQQGKDTYDFTIPKDMPAGNGTIAWTWFNKVGNREMYMNCGPVTITGSGGSQEAYNALPDMMVANLKGINDCTVSENIDVTFPNAGDSVDVFGTNLGPPNGTSCGTSSGGGSGGGSSGTPKPSTTAGNGGAAPTAAPTSAVASSKPSASKPTGNASLPGGVFITVPANGGASATPTASASATKAPAVTPSAAPSAAPSVAPSSGTGSGSGNGTTAGAQTVGAACTDEGAWNCVGGSSFQRCASGTWSSVQALAGGTSCTAGISSELSMVVTRNGRKRALRQRSLRFRSA